MLPKNPTVFYRCKTCHGCFLTKFETNKHLKKENHYIRTTSAPANTANSSGPGPSPPTITTNNFPPITATVSRNKTDLNETVENNNSLENADVEIDVESVSSLSEAEELFNENEIYISNDSNQDKSEDVPALNSKADAKTNDVVESEPPLELEEGINALDETEAESKVYGEIKPQDTTATEELKSVPESKFSDEKQKVSNYIIHSESQPEINEDKEEDGEGENCESLVNNESLTLETQEIKELPVPDEKQGEKVQMVVEDLQEDGERPMVKDKQGEEEPTEVELGDLQEVERKQKGDDPDDLPAEESTKQNVIDDLQQEEKAAMEVENLQEKEACSDALKEGKMVDGMQGDKLIVDLHEEKMIENVQSEQTMDDAQEEKMGDLQQDKVVDDQEEEKMVDDVQDDNMIDNQQEEKTLDVPQEEKSAAEDLQEEEDDETQKIKGNSQEGEEMTQEEEKLESQTVDSLDEEKAKLPNRDLQAEEKNGEPNEDLQAEATNEEATENFQLEDKTELPNGDLQAEEKNEEPNGDLQAEEKNEDPNGDLQAEEPIEDLQLEEKKEESNEDLQSEDKKELSSGDFQAEEKTQEPIENPKAGEKAELQKRDLQVDDGTLQAEDGKEEATLGVLINLNEPTDGNKEEDTSIQAASEAGASCNAPVSDSQTVPTSATSSPSPALSPTPSQRTFKCKQCNESFNHAYQVRLHMNREHKPAVDVDVGIRKTRQSITTDQGNKAITKKPIHQQKPKKQAEAAVNAREISTKNKDPPTPSDQNKSESETICGDCNQVFKFPRQLTVHKRSCTSKEKSVAVDAPTPSKKVPKGKQEPTQVSQSPESKKGREESARQSRAAARDNEEPTAVPQLRGSKRGKEEPEPASESPALKKAKEEPTPRKSRASSKLNEEPAQLRNSQASSKVIEEPAPVRNSRAASKTNEDSAPVRQSRASSKVKEEPPQPRQSRASSKVIEEPAPVRQSRASTRGKEEPAIAHQSPASKKDKAEPTPVRQTRATKRGKEEPVETHQSPASKKAKNEAESQSPASAKVIEKKNLKRSAAVKVPVATANIKSQKLRSAKKIETTKEQSKAKAEKKSSGNEELPTNIMESVEYRTCWYCKFVVSKFHNLKRHIELKHKSDITLDEIHAKQAKLIKKKKK